MNNTKNNCQIFSELRVTNLKHSNKLVQFKEKQIKVIKNKLK